jgi:protein-tyrosine phosphatase
MIDTHCHLLHDLDDGPTTVTDAVRLARSLVASGVEAAVCTPHYSRRYPTSHEVASERLRELSAALDSCEVSLELHLAAEVSSAFTLAEPLTELRRRSVAGGFIITEVQPNTPGSFFDAVLSRLEQAELTPVFAHPERCRAVRRRPALLVAAREAGALVQVVAPSVSGSWGPEIEAFAWTLLEEGQVDLLGSDAHGRKRPAADLQHALVLVGSRLGADFLSEICTKAPSIVLGGVHPRRSG